MSVVVTILLVLLGAACAVLLAALILPVRIECEAQVGERWDVSLALRPFGRIGPRIAVSGGDGAAAPTPATRKKTAKRGRSRLRDPRRVVRAALRLISDVFGRLQIQKAAVDLRFGAGDPAETGVIYGQLTPILYGIPRSRRVQLKVEPVFDRPIFDGQAAFVVAFVPARLIAPAFRFGWAAFGPVR